MYISEGIDDFIESLEVEGGRSKKTAENYQLYLERFIEFSGDILVKKIDSELVRKYRLWLNRYKNDFGKELSRTTQAYNLFGTARYSEFRTFKNRTAKNYQTTS